MAFKLSSLALLASVFLSSVSAAPIDDFLSLALDKRDGGSPGEPYQCAGNFSAAAHKQDLIGKGATTQGKPPKENHCLFENNGS